MCVQVKAVLTPIADGRRCLDCPRQRVAWFNHHRLLEPIGNVPPAEAEAAYYRQFTEPAMTS